MKPSRAITTLQAAALTIIVGIGALFAGLLASPLLQPAPSQVQTVKIGLLTHLTGPVAPTGLDILRGFQMGVEEINAAGGIFVSELNRKLPITPIVEDQQSGRDQTIAAATRLVNLHKADIIVGGFGSAFIVAAQGVIADAKTPYIITGVSTPRVVERTDIDNSWFVLYQAVGPEHGRSISLILAEAVRTVVAPNRNLKVAVIYQDSPFGADFFTGIDGTVKEKNLPITFVLVDKFKVGETDFRALLTKAAAAKPDVIVPIGFIAETIQSIRQGVRDLGINTLWGPVCVCVEDVTYYKDLGREGEYSLMQTYFGPYSSHPSVKTKVQEWAKRFQDRWGILPGSQGISAYDAVFVAAKALETAGNLDKGKIKDALRKLQMPQLLLPVPGGKIGFGQKGQQTFDLYGVQLVWSDKDNALRPVIVWPSNLAEAKLKLPPTYKPAE